MAKKTLPESSKNAICPRCNGQKYLKFEMGEFEGGYRRCHVCKGEGTVPFKSRDKVAEKKTAEERAAVFAAAQATMFDVAVPKKARL